MPISPISSLKSSTINSLVLRPSRSRYQHYFRCGLALCLIASALSIASDGYWLAAIGLLVSLALLFARCQSGPSAIRFDGRQWQVLDAANRWQVADIRLLFCYSALTGLRIDGTCGRARSFLFLWPDSAAPDELRRLRQRLLVSLPGSSPVQ